MAIITISRQLGAGEVEFTDKLPDTLGYPLFDALLIQQVAAALEVNKYDRETIDSGVKRTHIAQVMLGSRDAAIREVVAKMKPDASWESRRAAYPVMLKLCIAQFEKQ